MTTCATCGSQAPAGAWACPTCGQPLPDQGAAPPGVAAGGPAPVPNADQRNWGVIAHLTALAGFLGVPTFVGPLIVWLVKRSEHPFIAHHGAEALNFNLSVLLYAAVAAVGALATLGLGLIVILPVMLAGAVAWLVLTVMAAVRASHGEAFRYPLTIRFIS